MNHGFLSQPEQGPRPLQRSVPGGVTSDSGSMQYVSNDVFQELQQQGAIQESPGAESRRTSSRQTRGGIGHCPTKGETPFAFATSDSPRSRFTPPPPLYSDAPGPSRLPRPQVSRGGSREHPTASLTSSTPLSLPIGSEARSGTRRTPSRPRSSSAVSSQLLGGHFEADADFLTQEADYAAAVSAYSQRKLAELPDDERKYSSQVEPSRCVQCAIQVYFR